MDGDESAAFAASIQHSEDAVVYTTADGIVVAWSDGAQRMFGYTAREARGLSIGILYPAGAWSGAHRYAAGFSSESRQYETVLVRKGGGNVAVRATAFQVPGPSGAPRAYGTIYRDISAQKDAERRLVCKDAFANLLQTLVHVANESESPETAVAEGLRLVCRQYGWQLGHAVIFAPHRSPGVPALTLHYTDEPARFADFVSLAKRIDYSQPGAGVVGEVLARRTPAWIPDLRWGAPGARSAALLEARVRASYAFPVIAGGEVLAVIEFYGDASRPPEDALAESIGRVSQIFARMIERRRAAEEKAHLAAIVEGANDAIIARSLDGIITSWNHAAERLFGYSAAEAIGRPIAITLPPERHFLVDANNEKLRRDEPIAPQESPRTRKDGSTVHVSANVSPVRDAAGRVIGAAVILRDITETVEARRLLVRKVQFNALLQTLTRTANEAGTPAAALNECLRLIAEHGRWDAARVLQVPQSGARTVSALALSDEGEARGADAADTRWLTDGAEPVIPGLLDSAEPLWIARAGDFGDAPAMQGARAHGMRCAFGFTVVANGRALAALEFFSRAERSADALLIEHIVAISGQLARVVERHQFVIDVAKSERHLRAILDGEPACVEVVTAAGRLLSVNRAGLELLEARSAGELDAHGVMSTIAPEHLPRFADAMLRTIAGERCNLEYELVGLKGRRRWAESHTAPFALDDGQVAMLAVTRDITDRKRAEERVAHLAHHDALTGLPNRSLLQDRLRMSIAHAKRRGESVGVLIAGADRFRKVNESFGYEAGDALLCDLARRIASTLREADTLSRLGGDQFAILVDARNAGGELDGIAQKVHVAMREPFRVAGRDVFVNVSTGIACYPADAADPDALLDAAERAMNRVKDEGGAGYRRSDAHRAPDSTAAYGLETALHHALARGELDVHYQPRLDLASRAIVGCEALLRWNNPELGGVSPSRFIPIAEETGLIVPVGAWVLESACERAAAWHRAGHAIAVSVNLSPRQFRQDDLAATVARSLARSGLPPRFLELEITESSAMANPERAAQVLRELHALGVKLSVDDFGTGYSSLSYLREFPLDCLKIDRSFVDGICTSRSDEAIVRATIALAHGLNLATVGEGVESEAQHQRLIALGCDQGQGFYYARPLPPAALEALLSAPR